MSDITITLHNPVTGASESMPVADSLTVQEVLDLGVALLGIDTTAGGGQLFVTRYGKSLNVNKTLSENGVESGDLLAIMTPTTTTTTRPNANNNSLDFSSLLTGSGGGNNTATSTVAASGGGGFEPLCFQSWACL